MKNVSLLLLILSLYSCTTEICDDQKIQVEDILKLQLPRQCNCVSLYKTNYVNDELIGPYRYYIMIKDCDNFLDTLISKFSLIQYSDAALIRNSKQADWDSSGRMLAFYGNEYSNQWLWKLKTLHNINDTIPKWWTTDTSLVNNFANYYVINDSSISKYSGLDSIWNGKIVLQKKKNRTYIYIETLLPISGVTKNSAYLTNIKNGLSASEEGGLKDSFSFIYLGFSDTKRLRIPRHLTTRKLHILC